MTLIHPKLDNHPLPIVYADESIVVVNKLPGLLSVPGKSPNTQDCVVNRIRKQFPWACGPLTPHRLDMATSGLLILGLTRAAHRNLSLQFELRQVEKTYIAIVTGIVYQIYGTIKLPLNLDYPNRPRQMVDAKAGKPALTFWEVLQHEGNHTRIRFHPITGRTHQLRIHSAHPKGLGYSILGDKLYANDKQIHTNRLHLHAHTLIVKHPVNNETMEFTSPAPF